MTFVPSFSVVFVGGLVLTFAYHRLTANIMISHASTNYYTHNTSVAAAAGVLNPTDSSYPFYPILSLI